MKKSAVKVLVITLFVFIIGVIIWKYEAQSEAQAELMLPVTAANQQLERELMIGAAAEIHDRTKIVEATAQSVLASAMSRAVKYRVTEATTFYPIDFVPEVGIGYTTVSFPQLQRHGVVDQQVYLRTDRSQPLPVGFVLWHVRDFQPQLIPELSQAFPYQLVLIELPGDQELFGFVKSRAIDIYDESLVAPWITLPVTGDETLHKSVELQPGQTSAAFVVEMPLARRVSYFTSIVPAQPYYLKVGSQEVYVAGDDVRTPHIGNRATIRVRLPDDAQPATVHFVVSR